MRTTTTFEDRGLNRLRLAELAALPDLTDNVGDLIIVTDSVSITPPPTTPPPPRRRGPGRPRKKAHSLKVLKYQH